MRKMVTKYQQTNGVFLMVICGLLAVLFAQCLAGEAKQPKMLKEFLDGPMAGVDEIVFACRQLNYDGHWYANFGYYAENADRKAYRAMGRLCKLNLRTGQVTVLLDDPQGAVRDPQVHYDGAK
ncbi:MAG: hypothetical protein ACYSW3_26810, partial [Planctomycetota bacterium]